jgi:osmotically-inducible protein OsmY
MMMRYVDNGSATIDRWRAVGTAVAPLNRDGGYERSPVLTIRSSVMRLSTLAVLSALLIGCADRDTRTTRRATTSNTGTPRTTTDRNLTTAPGSPSTMPSTADSRTTTTTTTKQTEQTVNKPVITDPAAGRDADNTGVNKRDADTNLTKTPTDQKENKKDLDITAEIRKRLTDTKASINAQNVKIMTQDGKVTLRGPVKNDDEKQMIERMAREVAGEGNVENQLEVEKE